MQTLFSEDQHQKIVQVSDLNAQARQCLEQEFDQVWVEGEISNLAKPQSGHIYLTLKDDKAQIRGAFFKQAQKSKPIALANGQKVVIKAKVSLYAPRGDYQLIIQQIQDIGLGQLQQAYEALKQKLQTLGWFDTDLKKPLPQRPNAIGIITSPTGAALQDILHVLDRRFPATRVFIYPVMVQGTAAAGQISQAIDIANQRNEVDILIVGRGGGSLEDLWPFNEEQVARAIYESDLPIISAVGHQTDFTIADFVADLRAPTPSAAAEIAVPDWQELYSVFASYQQVLSQMLNSRLAQHQSQLQNLRQRLRHPQSKINEQTQRLDELTTRFHRAIQALLKNQAHRLEYVSTRLAQTSPISAIHRHQVTLRRLKLQLTNASSKSMRLHTRYIDQLTQRLLGLGAHKTLERGYAIVKNNTGQVIESVNALAAGDQVQLHFKDGQRLAQIKNP